MLHFSVTLLYRREILQITVIMQYSIEKPKGTFYSDYTIQNGICYAIFEHGSRVTSKRVCKTDKTNQNWREFDIQETETHLLIKLD